MPGFEVMVCEDGESCRLAVTGEVDLSAADDLCMIGQLCLQADASRLLIDLHGVTFLDSTGLGALVSIRNAGNELGKAVILCAVPARVAKLLTITGLADVFVTIGDASEAARAS